MEAEKVRPATLIIVIRVSMGVNRSLLKSGEKLTGTSISFLSSSTSLIDTVKTKICSHFILEEIKQNKIIYQVQS